MQRMVLCTVIIMSTFPLFGCRIKEDGRVAKLEKQVHAMNATITANKKKIKNQEFWLKLLRSELNSIDDSPARVSSDTEDFGLGRDQYGSFSVSVQKVKPYLDGYKVYLRVGNLTNATLGNAKIKIQWGKYGFGHSKEFQVPISFLPGRYTNTEVTLSPAKPQDVKTMYVNVNFRSMKLYLPLHQ